MHETEHEVFVENVCQELALRQLGLFRPHRDPAHRLQHRSDISLNLIIIT